MNFQKERKKERKKEKKKERKKERKKRKLQIFYSIFYAGKIKVKETHKAEKREENCFRSQEFVSRNCKKRLAIKICPLKKGDGKIPNLTLNLAAVAPNGAYTARFATKMNGKAGLCAELDFSL